MREQSGRLRSLDGLRGAIMILMALDHAVFFVTQTHPLEYWGNPLPQYQDVLSFLTRLSAHLCAPGFFFLMGFSMILFADSRRCRDWSEKRIMCHFVARGLLLLIIQQFVVNPAWFLGTFGSTEMLGITGPPGGGGDVYFSFDVLYGLGACMIVLAMLLRFNEVILTMVSVGAIVVAQVLTPTPDQVDTLYSPLVRFLLIPGQTGMMLVNYPVIPWLGVAGLGLVFGKLVLRDRQRAFRWLTVASVVFLLLFATARIVGGFGNLYSPDGANWVAFLSLTKYPPSLAFIAFTLSVDLFLLILFTRFDRLAWHHPLLVFGRTALFFYVVHIYVYALSGFVFPTGAELAPAYLVWLIGLVLLYPLCRWYEGFKQKRAPNSIWRFF